jgi:hypothetical protein
MEQYRLREMRDGSRATHEESCSKPRSGIPERGAIVVSTSLA